MGEQEGRDMRLGSIQDKDSYVKGSELEDTILLSLR